MADDGWDHAMKLQEAIQEAVNEDSDSHGMVTAYVAVVEVMDGDSKKLVSYRGPNPDAVPVWLARGMIREIVSDPEWFTRED